MKIAILGVIARQVDGETHWLDVLRAHPDPNVLYKYLRENNLPQTTEINGIPCVNYYSVIENVELEGLEDK